MMKRAVILNAAGSGVICDRRILMLRWVSPFARSNAHLDPAQLDKNAERAKIREYKERILNVEHADFNPLVFTTCGGMSPQSHIVLKRLAEKLSIKQNLLF